MKNAQTEESRIKIRVQRSGEWQMARVQSIFGKLDCQRTWLLVNIMRPCLESHARVVSQTLGHQNIAILFIINGLFTIARILAAVKHCGFRELWISRGLNFSANKFGTLQRYSIHIPDHNNKQKSPNNCVSNQNIDIFILINYSPRLNVTPSRV